MHGRHAKVETEHFTYSTFIQKFAYIDSIQGYLRTHY